MILMGERPVDDGQWHHTAGVYDGSVIRLYVDGELDASKAASGEIGANSAAVLIGENSELRPTGWNGLIDDVRIYNYALTADQIKDLHAGHGPGREVDPQRLIDKVTEWQEAKANQEDSNSPNMIAWWKFDEAEDARVLDSSGNNLHGRLLGDAKIVPDSARGKVLSLDGDGDYVDCGNNPLFDIRDEITIAAWIKVKAFDREWQTIVSKGEWSWRLHRNSTFESIKFNITRGPLLSVAGNVNVNDGKWHQIVATYNGVQIHLYVNGILDKVEYVSGVVGTSTESVNIGANAEEPGREWNGLIDDVRIYGRALTQKEVRALYKNTATVSLKKAEGLAEDKKE